MYATCVKYMKYAPFGGVKLNDKYIKHAPFRGVTYVKLCMMNEYIKHTRFGG